MATLIDILGATIIGMLIFFMIVNFNVTSSTYKLNSDMDLQVIGNAKNLAQIIDYDLRKIGFLADSNKILIAEKRRIQFKSDIDSNNVVDIIEYKLGDSTQALGTENPHDKPLIKILNSNSLSGPTLGLVDLQFTYTNASGNITTTLNQIKSIKVEIWVQSTSKIDNQYPSTYWEMTISPRNL